MNVMCVCALHICNLEWRRFDVCEYMLRWFRMYDYDDDDDDVDVDFDDDDDELHHTNKTKQCVLSMCFSVNTKRLFAHKNIVYSFGGLFRLIIWSLLLIITVIGYHDLNWFCSYGGRFYCCHLLFIAL